MAHDFGKFASAVTLTAALTLALAAPALAEQKIGWVNAQSALDDTKAGQEIKKRVEAYRDSRQSVIDIEEQELKSLETKLEQQLPMLSERAAQEKQLEFQQRLMGYQKKVVALNRELNDKKGELLQEFSETLTVALERVAKAGGYDFILDKGQDGAVLFGASRFDLTDKVMAEIDGAAN